MELNFYSNRFDVNLRLGKARPDRVPEPSRSQTREGYQDSVISMFNQYLPFIHNLGLFTLIRETFPFMDVGILTLTRLRGDFKVISTNQTFADEMNEWWDAVQFNDFNIGGNAYLDEIQDSTFETGFGLGEIIPYKGFNGIARLKTVNPASFRFVIRDGKLLLGFFKNNEFQPIPLDKPEFVNYTTFDTRKGHPQGYSLIYSTVQVSQVLTRWMKSFDNQLARFGDPSLFGSIEGGQNSKPNDLASARTSLANQLKVWNQDRKKGQTSDITAAIPSGGKALLSVIGSDAKLVNLSEDIRTLEEMFVAKTHLPPPLLGLTWSTTERNIEIQMDKLQSILKFHRRRMKPGIYHVFDTQLNLSGNSGKQYEIEWEPLTLLDEVKQAQARNLETRADLNVVQTVGGLIDYGIALPEEIETYLKDQGIKKSLLSNDWFMKSKKRFALSKTIKGLLH